MENLKAKVSVIMPAYNEANCILNSIEETAKTLEAFVSSWQIIILDDGSSDDTFENATTLMQSYPGRLVVKKNPFHLGKGRAIKKALHYADGDYVAFLDADMDIHPKQIKTLFEIMQSNNADIVIGSKLDPNSKVNYPLERRIITWVYYFFVRLLFNLPCHDTQTGLKLFKIEVLRKVFPRILVKQFAFDLEVLVNAYHLGYRIAEAPIVMNGRKSFGHIGIRALYTILLDTLAIFYRLRILKYYDRIDYYRHKNMAKEFRRMRK